MQHHTTGFFRTTALCLGLLATVPALAQAPSTPARQEMSIVQINDKLTALGDLDARSIERQHGVVEVRASDKNGARVKLYPDAVTGGAVNNLRHAGERSRAHSGHSSPAYEGNHDSRHHESDGKGHERGGTE